MPDYGYQNAAMAAEKIGGVYGAEAKMTYTDTAPEVSPFIMAGQAYEDVHALVHRLAMLADRLTGPAPTNVNSSAGVGIDQPRPPLFHALRMEAQRAANAVRSGHDALERIERFLS